MSEPSFLSRLHVWPARFGSWRVSDSVTDIALTGLSRQRLGAGQAGPDNDVSLLPVGDPVGVAQPVEVGDL